MDFDIKIIEKANIPYFSIWILMHIVALLFLHFSTLFMRMKKIHEYEVSTSEDQFHMFLQDSIINDVKLDLDTIYFIGKCPTSYGSDLAYVKDNSMNNNVKIDEE